MLNYHFEQNLTIAKSSIFAQGLEISLSVYIRWHVVPNTEAWCRNIPCFLPFNIIATQRFKHLVNFEPSDSLKCHVKYLYY